MDNTDRLNNRSPLFVSLVLRRHGKWGGGGTSASGMLPPFINDSESTMFIPMVDSYSQLLFALTSMSHLFVSSLAGHLFTGNCLSAFSSFGCGLFEHGVDGRIDINAEIATKR